MKIGQSVQKLEANKQLRPNVSFPASKLISSRITASVLSGSVQKRSIMVIKRCVAAPII